MEVWDGKYHSGYYALTERISQLSKGFNRHCAIETRMHILFMMLDGPCSGQRVVDIASRTNLSRPAVSHHMQILKDAALVKARKEGACIYYYLEPQPDQIAKLIGLFQDIQRIMSNVPDRSGEV